MCHSVQSLACSMHIVQMCLWKRIFSTFSSLDLGKLFSTLVLVFCFPPLFLMALTQTAVTKLSAVQKGAKPFQMLRTSFRAVFRFTSFLVFLQITLWCHWVDLDIRYTISMWDNFPTNWPHSQSWLVCWISRDQNEMHPKSLLFFYALDCYSKVVLEPNFLKVDRTSDLSHLGTRLHPTPVAGDEEDKSF